MISPVDLTNLNDMTDGDTDAQQILFAEFCLSAEACLTRLAAHDKNGNTELWRATAHALKSIAVNLGAERLAALSHQAQEAFLAMPADRQALLVHIRAEYAAVKTFLYQAH